MAAIVDDLIISRISKELLKINDVKSKYFRSATIKDVEDNINAILKREPDFMIIHEGKKQCKL